MRYEVNETAASFYAEDQDEAFLVAGQYPNGDAWDQKQAKEWADIFIFAATNLDSQYVPGPSAANPIMLRSDLPEIPKPVTEQEAEPEVVAEEDNAGTDAAI